MFSICILTALFFSPACLGGVFDSEGASQVGNGNVRSRARSDSNRVLMPSLNIRNAPPEVMEAMPGDSKVLECEAGGNPPPTIHWLKDGKRIAQSLYEAVHRVGRESGAVAPVLGLSFTRSRLFVDCVTARDIGTYTCVAENTYTRKSKSSQLLVMDLGDGDTNAICLAKKSFGSPARIHMWTHTTLELMGSDVQLFCRPDGEPEPQVVWLGPNNVPLADPEKYQILENGDLVIRSIDWEDMGGYTCEVKNSEGSDETLTFLYPTMPEKRKVSKE